MRRRATNKHEAEHYQSKHFLPVRLDAKEPIYYDMLLYTRLS